MTGVLLFLSLSFLINFHFSYNRTDEKEKYDPAGFRDFIVVGLNTAGSDVDAIWKFLDSAGSKVDYRRYGEALFDILIAGGLLGELNYSFYLHCGFFSLFSILFESKNIYNR